MHQRPIWVRCTPSGIWRPQRRIRILPGSCCRSDHRVGCAARGAAHCGQERGHMWQQPMFPLSRGRLSHRHRFTGRRPTGMNIEVFSPLTQFAALHAGRRRLADLSKVGSETIALAPLEVNGKRLSRLTEGPFSDPSPPAGPDGADEWGAPPSCPADYGTSRGPSSRRRTPGCRRPEPPSELLSKYRLTGTKEGPLASA